MNQPGTKPSPADGCGTPREEPGGARRRIRLRGPCAKIDKVFDTLLESKIKTVG